MNEQKNEGMQQTLPCAVVQDLMPLEIDGVASRQSSELVRAHMERCEGCRAAYARMNAEISLKEQEQIPALRDVMRALWRRLSVRAALAAAAVSVLLCIAAWTLSITVVGIPSENIVRDSIEMTIDDGCALLRYATIRDRRSHTGYGYRFEENLQKENELTLYICNRTSLLRKWQDYALYALTGEGMAQHEIDLCDLVSGYGAARYPQDAVISAVVYRDDIDSERGESLVLWQAEEEQYPLLTMKALAEGYQNRFRE